jgi:hypothetical protein
VKKGLGAFLTLAGMALAQTLTLEQAVQEALSKYPAVRSSLDQVSAAAAGINLARTSYLPRADFLGQLNRATHNNVFGMLLAQPVISPISGPVLRPIPSTMSGEPRRDAGQKRVAARGRSVAHPRGAGRLAGSSGSSEAETAR